MFFPNHGKSVVKHGYTAAAAAAAVALAPDVVSRTQMRPMHGLGSRRLERNC